ncbi:uncharacterized protein LOC115235589 [Formica exsecta]|uniref:uncharacterized protein LOC115235589 n=1 Tax=Formica exsecta TaxID=72781 RepID=UPI001142CB8D|nr:uncharacterized protein LOC115235589 [Formica exsecta]
MTREGQKISRLAPLEPSILENRDSQTFYGPHKRIYLVFSDLGLRSLKQKSNKEMYPLQPGICLTAIYHVRSANIADRFYCLYCAFRHILKNMTKIHLFAIQRQMVL